MLPHAPYNPDTSPPYFDLFPELKEHMRGRHFSSLEELSTDGTRAIRHVNKSSVLDGIIMLPKRWDSVIEKQSDNIEGLWTDNLKEITKYRVLYFWNDFLIGTRTIVRITNMFQNSHYKKPIFQELISRVLLNIERGVECLYSPWASDHLYRHQNNWITISIL